jgi:hypothetical protein
MPQVNARGYPAIPAAVNKTLVLALPTMIVFFLAQRQSIQGISLTGITS